MVREAQIELYAGPWDRRTRPLRVEDVARLAQPSKKGRLS
jgi:hypothetical protein